MKTLQNNFTTPEQSKRLLELGVPADSVNCYKIESELYDKGIRVRYSDYELNPEFFSISIRIPCWSVGRLIEIMTICSKETNTSFVFSHTDGLTIIGNIIRCIQLEIECGRLDFSKLED